jgi:hypothetical protein
MYEVLESMDAVMLQLQNLIAARQIEDKNPKPPGG